MRKSTAARLIRESREAGYIKGLTTPLNSPSRPIATNVFSNPWEIELHRATVQGFDQGRAEMRRAARHEAIRLALPDVFPNERNAS